MQIWVDADACPRPVKEILFRAAQKRRVMVTLVANKPLFVPPGQFVRAIQVAAGADVADRRIVEELAAGDLVISADIPMAADVIAKGGWVLDPRGEMLTEENVQERLSIRNFMDELRSGGVETGGPASFGKGDRQRFANQLDRFLTQNSS